VENGLNNLFARLAGGGRAPAWGVRDAHGAEEDAEVVVNFGDGADGGTRRARGGFLLDGDGGRKAFDDVDFGTLHLVEKLARVSGKGFDVAALAFGVNGIEGERRFA